MMSSRSMICAFAVTLAAATAQPASAQPPSGSSPPASSPGKSAEELYKDGVRLYEAKKWAEAEREFRAAWALNPTFDVAYNLGNATFRQGKHRDAAEYLAYALRVWPLLESTSALRFSAATMQARTSPELVPGMTAMWLITPLTPRMWRTAFSASIR